MPSYALTLLMIAIIAGLFGLGIAVTSTASLCAIVCVVSCIASAVCMEKK